jgi:hypothetical protein
MFIKFSLSNNYQKILLENHLDLKNYVYNLTSFPY